MNKEMLAGLLVIGTAAAGIGTYLTVIVDTAVTEYNVYTLDAKDVSGIEVGTPVNMAGYNVGSVREIVVSYDPSLQFEVELVLKPEIPIPDGVIVQLGTRLTGGGLINLIPPDEIQGFLSPETHLTLVPSTDIQSLLDSTDSILKDLAIMTKRGREFVEDPDQGLELRLLEVDKILIEVNTLLDQLTALARSSTRLVEDNSPLLKETLANTETLTNDSVQIVSQMDASLKEFDSQMVAFGELMDGYDPDRNQEMKLIIHSLKQSSDSLSRLMKSMEKSPLRTIRKGVETPTKNQTDTVMDD